MIYLTCKYAASSYSGNKITQHYAYDLSDDVIDKDTVGVQNPFRCRGYYYDTETGLYYVSSRYYVRRSDRFISADDLDVVKASLTALTDKNSI